MRRTLVLAIALVSLTAGTALAQGQVASAEFQGVDMTLPHSRGVSGWMADGSVGEGTVVVLALDAAGNPVAGAPVAWTVTNATDSVVYVVAGNGVSDVLSAYNGMALSITGGTTGADGTARLVVDSLSSGDARVAVEVGGMEAETYSGGSMRVVWF
jgi:hypothetical protein